MFDISPQIVWIVIAIIFAIIEGVTMGLITIWFTIGAVAAAIAAACGISTNMQLSIFIVVSALLIVITRPIAEKRLKVGKEKTNVSAMSGKTGVVTENIPPHGSGQVKVNGQIWTAILEDESSYLEEGSEVTVISVQGVKLLVKAKE